MSRVKRAKMSGPSLDDEYPIWMFVYENLCQKQLYTDADESLFRDYLEKNPDKKWFPTELMDYFNNTMCPTLYKCEFPAETVFGLYKKLDIEISPHIEQILEEKFHATIRIDGDRCLHSFRLISMVRSEQERAPVAPPAVVAPTGSPVTPQKSTEEQRRRKLPVPSIPHDMRVTESFERRMWKHVFDNFDRLTMEVLMSEEFWQDMIDRLDMPLASATLLLHHYCSRMVGKLYMAPVEAEKRLQLYQKMKWQVSQEAMEWFLEKDRVKVDPDFYGYALSWEVLEQQQQLAPPLRKIATWVPRDAAPNVPSCSNSAPLPTTENRLDSDDSGEDMRPGSAFGRFSKKKRVQFTEADRLNVWKHIYKEIRKAIELERPAVLPKGLAFWSAYVRKTKSSKTETNWSSHFRKKMCPTLYEMELPREQILFLYKHIEIDISDHVKDILERKFQVKLHIGHNGQLIGWEPIHEEQEKESDNDEVGNQDDSAPGENAEDNDAMLPIGSNRSIDQRLVASDGDEEAQRTPANRATAMISPIPDLDLDKDSESDEEMDQMASAERPEGGEEQGAKTPGTPQQLDEIVSPSKMTLRKRPGSSPSEKTPFKKPDTPVKSPNKKGSQPADSLDDVPDSQFALSMQPSCDMFLEDDAPEGPLSDYEEEREMEEKKKEWTDFPAFDSEYMSHSELLSAIQQTLEEIDDDEVVDLISEAVDVAFRKENWDESGNLDSSLFNSIATIIKSNTEGARQKCFLKNIERLMKRLLSHVENRQVYEKRAEGVREMLQKKVKPAKEKKAGPSNAGN